MKKNLTMLAIAAIVAAGCTESEVIEKSQKMAIGFDTYVGKNTRGVPNTSTAFPEGSTMGIFATKVGAATNDVMNNQLVTKEASGWAYSPVKYYEANEQYTFNAYAPYIASEGSIASETGLTNYVVPTDITQQVDLVYANKVTVDVAADGSLSIDESPTDNVKFEFRHALSQVKFSAKLDAAPAEGDFVKVTSITIDKVKSTGTFTFADGLWNVNSETTAKYAVTPTAPVELNNTASTPVSPADGHVLMLIPQESEVTIALELSVKKGDKTENKTYEVPRTDQWYRNNIYHYTITVKTNSIEFGDPRIEIWESSNNDIVVL